MAVLNKSSGSLTTRVLSQLGRPALCRHFVGRICLNRKPRQNFQASFEVNYISRASLSNSRVFDVLCYVRNISRQKVITKAGKLEKCKFGDEINHQNFFLDVRELSFSSLASSWNFSGTRPTAQDSIESKKRQANAIKIYNWYLLCHSNPPVKLKRLANAPYFHLGQSYRPLLYSFLHSILIFINPSLVSTIP